MKYLIILLLLTACDPDKGSYCEFKMKTIKELERKYETAINTSLFYQWLFIDYSRRLNKINRLTK